jgi:hypothetical protein
MGRGRNKAKAQKVAREIKYMKQEPDFEALSRELRHEARHPGEEDRRADQTADQRTDRAR